MRVHTHLILSTAPGCCQVPWPSPGTRTRISENTTNSFYSSSHVPILTQPTLKPHPCTPATRDRDTSVIPVSFLWPKVPRSARPQACFLRRKTYLVSCYERARACCRRWRCPGSATQGEQILSTSSFIPLAFAFGTKRKIQRVLLGVVTSPGLGV